MVTINRNEFLGLVYADLFNFPLTREELRFWAIKNSRPFTKYQGKIESDGKYFFLKNRKSLVRLREQKEKLTPEKITKAKKTVSLLVKIPTVRGVFLTGSVAVQNASSRSDIDLMVITSPNTLWLTRFLLVALLKIQGRYREKKVVSDKICPNIFLDSDHLEIKEKNLYIAHEILQAKCLFDRGGIEKKWLVSNSWTRRYLPQAYQFEINLENQSTKINKYQSPKSQFPNFWNLEVGYWLLALGLGFLSILEPLAFFLEYLYMKPKITNENISLHHAFFHPRDLSNQVLADYGQKLQSLGLTN